MKAGETFIVTSGEYSDFGIRDSLRALVDFDWNECVTAYLELHPDQSVAYGGEFDKFLSWLREIGKVETAPLIQVHIGDYGTFDRNVGEIRGVE